MRAIHKNIIREISRTRSRFISILAIVALSVGFFSGVKASSPSMIRTGECYFIDQHLMDFRLISTVGFDEEDVEAIAHLDASVEVMPSYSSNLLISQDNIDSVVAVYALPQKTKYNQTVLNEPIVTQGRLPQKSGECVIESYYYEKFSQYRIGDTITFNRKVQDKDTTDTVAHLTYTIVGVVQSPMHITYQRGNTNLGSGSISFFIMILPEDFRSERYTCVYVRTRASRDYPSFQDEQYKDAVRQDAEEIEALSRERIRIFNDSTLKEAQDKLADAKKEYADGEKEAKESIADGEKKLLDGEKEYYEKLLEGEQKLKDGEAELEDGRKQLADGKTAYQEGIAEAKEKLTEAQKQYSSGKAEYERSKQLYDSEIEKAEKQLSDAETAYNLQYTIFYSSTKPQAESKMSLMKTAIDLAQQAMDGLEERIALLDERLPDGGKSKESIEKWREELAQYRRKIEDYQQQYDEGQRQLQEGEAQLLAAGEQLTEAKQQLAEKKAEGAAKLGEAKLQLDEAESQLTIGRLEYDAAVSGGLLELQEAETKLSEGEKELQEGKKQLETEADKGLARLKEARELLLFGKYQASSQLSDGAEKIREAEKQIEALQDAKWYVYDRSDNPGYANLEEDAQRVDNVATVFPIFFLLVSALVCLTTMSRMVEERRTEIGTLKALGYSHAAIASKYFIYAAAAAVLGSVIGAVIGLATLPFIILDTYSMMYTLPKTVLVIPWESLAFSAGTGILCTCLVATLTCYRELKINPATLMRPKAPKPGKRILLEYVTPLWKMMNFTSKVTARNLFRYKARFCMTVIGVAGCTALIVGGLGLKDSISVIADRQYQELTIYDEIYALTKADTVENKQYLMAQFHEDRRFRESLLAYQGWTTVQFQHNNEKLDLHLVIGEDTEQFQKMFILRDRTTHTPVTLDDEGVIITERLSELAGAGVGDDIRFTIGDDYFTSRVTGITENYAGNFIYMTPKQYQTVTGKELEYNIVFVQVADSAKSEEHTIAHEWMEKDDIMTVSMINDTLASIQDMLSSLNVIVLVLIVCAGLLAVVVLYNLTNINISERVREIATIKVLGFYNLETANYIYRENIVLTLCGAALGLPIGTVFNAFIMMSIQMDMVMFPQFVQPVSYWIGFGLTVLFSLLVNAVMYVKMNRISMVESLKSIE